MPLPFAFDFKNPDYKKVFEWRISRLNEIRLHSNKLIALKEFYKENPSQFIIDWGVTFDPRNIEKNLPALIPFILFPRQEEWINWFIDCWKNNKNCLTDKSREMGMSWICIAVSCTICLFNDGVVVGFGSRKEEYVDKKGDPKSLLYKARQFLQFLPKEFKGNWDEKKHAPYMRIVFPDSNSVITGEAGSNIGRGARASFYIIDEAAWLEHPDSVEAALSQSTNCRLDISTPNGMANPFARKRFSGKVDVFSFHWREDPRKDDKWYQAQCEKLNDPVIIAQEIDLDYMASVEGVVIPAEWVRSAVDAHIKLGIEVTGKKLAGFDVADEGADKNAICLRHGILVDKIIQWSGVNGDIYSTIEKVFTLCDMNDNKLLYYDADGLGAGVRGDARKINEKRKEQKKAEIKFSPFRGSGEIINPRGDPFSVTGDKLQGTSGRTNADFFANLKAQSWWSLRQRFLLTYRAVIEDKPYNKDDIISINSKIPYLHQIIIELSQPCFGDTNAGKLLIKKKPEGARSPNIGDSIMIAFAPEKIFQGVFAL